LRGLARIGRRGREKVCSKADFKEEGSTEIWGIEGGSILSRRFLTHDHRIATPDSRGALEKGEWQRLAGEE